MKKLLKPFILLGTIALMTLSFSLNAGSLQNGTTHTAQVFDGDGNYVGSISAHICDPCGSWIRSVVACNCHDTYGTHE